MRGWPLLVLLLTTSVACSPLDRCHSSCDGCCDARGTCRTNQAWACGKAGGDCRACAPGQTCNGSCVGDRVPDRLSLQSNNTFIPRSAQAFRVATPRLDATNFIALSNADHDVCRDPYVAPDPGERVIIFSEFNGMVDGVVLVTPEGDGGVRRFSFTSAAGMSFGADLARADMNLNERGIVLVGSVEAPYCGTF
jgi:hypothetical protein